MQPNLFPMLGELAKANQTFVVCTVVSAVGSAPRHVGAKMAVLQDGSRRGTIGGGEMEHRVIKAALECLANGSARVVEYKLTDINNGDPGVCGGQVGIFIEPVKPAPRMIVVGAGHVGRALSKLAKWLGFYVVISDDRAEYCNENAIPDADEYIVCSLAEIPNKAMLTASDNVILTTRGVRIDIPGLPPLLQSNAGFIGIIGSKRRWVTTRNELLDKGFSQDLINKVHSPIGIDIHAETPEEIALSIMAEVMIHTSGTSGESMNMNAKPNK